MNYSDAFNHAAARLPSSEWTEDEIGILSGDFADRCTGDVPGFPGLPETDNIHDEWRAYVRDIGEGNLHSYARMLLS